MPAPFFKLAYRCVKNPKRIVWAYDELQNLSSSIMPSIEEMFGSDENGKPLVELKNEPDEPMQDIILPVCYRNPPWALALAHSLGFGIYRDHLVQHFDALELWEDIGYKKDKGSLAFGKKVTLSRRPDATPNYFYELLNPQDVIKTRRFEDVDSGNVKKCAVGKHPKSEKHGNTAQFSEVERSGTQENCGGIESGCLLRLHPLPVPRRRQPKRVACIDPDAVVVDKNIAKNDRFDLFSR